MRTARTSRSRASARAVTHLAAIAIAIGLLAISGTALADAPAERSAAVSDDAARAMALHDEARGHYERGEYREAITKLEIALRLDPQGQELVYNLALIHEKLAEIDAAERYYRLYLSMLTTAKDRERIEGVLRRIEGAAREIAQRPSPVADAPAAPPPPARAPAAREGLEPWTLVLAGIAAGGAAVGTAFAVSAVTRDPGSSARTGGGVTVATIRGDASIAHSHAVLADVSFLLAAAAAGAAVYVQLGSRDAASAPTSATVSVGPTSATLVVRY